MFSHPFIVSQNLSCQSQVSPFRHDLVSHKTICYSHSFTIVETPKQSKKVRKDSLKKCPSLLEKDP